jgi:hypothetical protein
LSEAGYYNVIFDEFDEQQKSVVSWHAHFLVWGISQNTFDNTLKR